MRVPSKPRPWPEGHPISLAKAKALVQGPLGAAYEKIALSCSAPLCWFRPTDNLPRILHNGTMTVVRTHRKLFGITAAHVVRQFNVDQQKGVTLQVKDQIVEGLRIIDSSSKRDLTTFDLEEQLIKNLGLEPIEWPFQLPAEGSGLLLAGYPGNTRVYAEPMQIDWSPFFAITTAKTVTLDQITILVPADDDSVKNSLPLDCDLGGISGGPVIGIFETKSYVAFHRLSGVITDPSYDKNEFSVERIVGAAAEAITELGTIR
ncbi:MAG TPA: hypothetical protein VGP62_04795 [Bryobacteraceae bacterium]|jgi:hypothetical protein|nr:hypothetical protein [Bryobacteraceae bacterium]